MREEFVKNYLESEIELKCRSINLTERKRRHKTIILVSPTNRE